MSMASRLLEKMTNQYYELTTEKCSHLLGETLYIKPLTLRQSQDVDKKTKEETKASAMITYSCFAKNEDGEIEPAFTTKDIQLIDAHLVGILTAICQFLSNGTSHESLDKLVEIIADDADPFSKASQLAEVKEENPDTINPNH